MFEVSVNHAELDRVVARIGTLTTDGSPVWRSMGTTLKSITEGTFNSVGAAFRPKAWPPKRDGTPSILQQSTTLSKAFHLEVTRRSATVRNSTKYAAIHQFGGVIRAVNAKALRFTVGGQTFYRKSVRIPARPFFPISDSGRLTEPAARMIARAGARAIDRLAKSGRTA